MNNDLRNNNLHETFQSAYRVHHSTETVMVKVQDDILHAIDSNRAVVPLMLDLSAAFDTMSYEILLNRVSQRYGITAISTQSSFAHVEESAHSQTRKHWSREWVYRIYTIMVCFLPVISYTICSN